jgi:hypothetical protein
VSGPRDPTVPACGGPNGVRRAGTGSEEGTDGAGGIVMAEPTWVPMSEDEHRDAVEALGALLAWAAAHPEQWRGRRRSPGR